MTARHFPVPDGAEGAWLAHARRLPDFTCEATFSIEPDLYIGPDNGLGTLARESVTLELPPVDVPRRHAGFVTTTELLGHEAPLIEHYRRIVALAQQHGKKSATRPFPYFRLKPAVIATGEVLTKFDWNDDLNETRTVLDAFVEASTGDDRLVYFDLDQGWEIQIVATAFSTCWIEWDAEGPPPETGGYAVDRTDLAHKAMAALERLQTIHGRLVAALGHDYWTYRPPLSEPTQPQLPSRPRSGFSARLAKLFKPQT